MLKSYGNNAIINEELNKFTIMSYNVRCCDDTLRYEVNGSVKTRVNYVIKNILYYMPDSIGFQEVTMSSDPKTITWDSLLKDGLKNNYIGRTFIKPDKDERNIAVRLKLNVLKEVVKDKRIVLIDDSIVRGTTTKEIINILKDAGAKEIHIRISSPPFLYPCYFGIDVPEKEELMAKASENIPSVINIYLNINLYIILIIVFIS